MFWVKIRSSMQEFSSLYCTWKQYSADIQYKTVLNSEKTKQKRKQLQSVFSIILAPWWHVAKDGPVGQTVWPSKTVVWVTEREKSNSLFKIRFCFSICQSVTVIADDTHSQDSVLSLSPEWFLSFTVKMCFIARPNLFWITNSNTIQTQIFYCDGVSFGYQASLKK